jgi:hypothetical protein
MSLDEGVASGPAPDPGAPSRPPAPTARRARVSGRRLALGRLRPAHLGLATILALSGLLEFVKLSQNGYANTFYSAAVTSMLRSWHNFFFVASDPNGFITVDKPPLALWLQALSARVFGFAPLSLIVPEGICAVLAVALLYRILTPRFGVIAGLLGAFALAVFPSFVAVSRDNAVDPLLILLMLASCGAAPGGDRLGAPANVGLVRGAGGACVQHEVAGRAALRAGHRPRLPRLRTRIVAAPRRAAGAGGRGVRGGCGVVVAGGRSDAGVTATLRRGQHHELRVPARVRLQRLRPRRRAAGWTGKHRPAADTGPAGAARAARCGRGAVGGRAPLLATQRVKPRVAARTSGLARAGRAKRPPAARGRAVRRYAQPGADLRGRARRPGGLARAARADRHAGARPDAARSP